MKTHLHRFGSFVVLLALALPAACWPVRGQTPPAIVVQPRSQHVPAGSDVVLVVVADGEEPLRYQWLRDGVSVPLATQAALTLPLVQSAQMGRYTVRVSNAHGACSATRPSCIWCRWPAGDWAGHSRPRSRAA
jgi:hypothetical protein